MISVVTLAALAGLQLVQIFFLNRAHRRTDEAIKVADQLLTALKLQKNAAETWKRMYYDMKAANAKR